MISRRFTSLLRNLFRGRRVDRELDAELRSYVDMLADEKMAAGVPPERARREARIALGGIEQVKEEVRAIRAGVLLEQLGHDIRYAARGLRKAPAFSITAVAILALGIGANTAVFSVIDALLFRPLPVARPDRLVAVYRGESGGGAFSYPDFIALRQRNDLFDNVAAWSTSLAWVRLGADIERLNVHLVSPGYFATMGLAPQTGTTFATTSDDAARGMLVLSDRLWRTRFGADLSITGRSLTVDGHPVSIVGVAPAGFTGLDPSAPADAWITFATLSTMQPEWDFRAPTEIWLNVIARLGDGIDRRTAEATVSSLGLRDAAPAPQRFRLVPAATPIFDPERRAGSSRLAALVWGVAGFVLLIACANVASLLLVRGSARRREIGLRMAVGASRARVARQMVTESGLLALIGCASGLFAAHWTIRAVVAFAPRTAIPPGIPIGLDARVVLFATLLSILTALIFGVAPAWQAARLDLLPHVKGGPQGDIGAGRATLYFRRSLVIAQVALSAVLLVGAGLFLRTLAATLAIEPGYDVSRVLLTTVDFSVSKMTPPAAWRAGSQVLERVRALPGVEGAAFGQIVPFSGAFVRRPVVPAELRAEKQADTYSVPYGVVSEGYFQSLGMPLRGRDFQASDAADAPLVAIVNQTLARRYWPGQDAIGKRITMPLRAAGPEIEIVGVVPDGKYVELTEAQQPFVYVPWTQMHRTRITLHVRTAGQPAAQAGAVRNAIREVSPDIPAFNTTTLMTYLERSTAQPRFVARLLFLFAVIALAVAAVGVYGLTAYNVTRRTKEIGLRVALGARPAALVGTLVSESAALVVAGLTVGTGVAMLLTRLVTSLLFGVTPWDPASFLTAGLLLALTLVIATVLPARRAAQVDPLSALRVD